MTLTTRLKWRGSIAPSFGKGVYPSNLRLCPAGHTHVSLGPDWSGITQDLSTLGDVLASTQNAAASLAQLGRFPRFDICDCGRIATSRFGGIGFDFGDWCQVWATRRSLRGDVWHTLSIMDRAQRRAHQILLMGQVDENHFASFVRSFQGAPDTAPQWPFRAEARCKGYRERSQDRKWNFVEPRDSGAKRRPVEILPTLLSSVISEQLLVSVTVLSHPVTQTTLWKPTRLEIRGTGLTLSSELTHLQLRPNLVAEVWTVPMPSEEGGGVILECYDEHDCLLFAISAADNDLKQWLELLSRAPLL